LPSGFVVDDSPRIVERKYVVTICRKNDNIRFAAAPTGSHPFYRPPHSALNINDGIIIATVVSNIRITSDDCDQEVRHLELDISNHCTPIAYRPGAVALIYPENMDGVEEFFRLTNLKPDDLVAIQSLNDNQPTMLPSQCSVWDLASKFLDIQGIPRRSFFEQLSLFASNPEEVALFLFATV
jgi:sulfite reductase alpha subunit-like flavoprotein